MNQTVAIELNLINAILQYLSKRPFDEVVMIVPALKQQAEASLQAQQQPQPDTQPQSDMQPEELAE